MVAERVGFEPTVLSHTAFRERHHQPLGHLSADEHSKGPRRDRSCAIGGWALESAAKRERGLKIGEGYPWPTPQPRERLRSS